MPIIYEPQQKWGLREFFDGAVVPAATLAAVDYAVGANKPWAYYAGIVTGRALAATGIPGATMTVYVVGDQIDFYVNKSVDGSLLRWYLNGVQVSSIDTYAISQAYELVQLALQGPNTVSRVDVELVGASANPDASGIPWLALYAGQVYGDNPVVLSREDQIMPSTLTIRFKDAEQDTRTQSMSVVIPDGHTVAEIQSYSDALVGAVEAMTGAQITEASVMLGLTLPGGLKASPDAGSLNERGGLIALSIVGENYGDSVRVPAILSTIMPGDTFDVEAAPTDTLVDLLVTGDGTIRPINRYGDQYEAAVAGRKSFRK